jgi:hypothetical protein
MEKKKVNIDHLLKLNAEANERGEAIESFRCDEISLMPDGSLEMGAVYDVKYKTIDDGSVQS